MNDLEAFEFSSKESDFDSLNKVASTRKSIYDNDNQRCDCCEPAIIFKNRIDKRNHNRQPRITKMSGTKRARAAESKSCKQDIRRSYGSYF